MELKKTFIWGILLFFWLLVPAGYAAIDWDLLQTLKLNEAPVDVAFSTSRNKIFVLTEDGEIQVFDTNGRQVDAVKVGKEFDQIRHIQGSDVVLLSSRRTKTVKIIELNFVEEIDTNGAPYRGPKDASVTLVVFSDFE